MTTSFTITQPFLGAPLQFLPALGSKELEALIDAYVIGNGSKQDKLSVVTVDFFNHATVDLNTGALTRTYDVFFPALPAFEQSPFDSQASGFSPPIFTPSPGSSATFGDSGYGSFSRSTPNVTPPTRTLGPARVAKKTAKKDAKKPKVEEARLPGFSIMTKDGIDVTTTAGRGTKTKEQREHAHLMRIMKACDSCKRKKIRCDPSHRRSHNDMARTSTSTSKASSSSTRPSPQYESPGSAPALTRQSTQASPPAAFTPSNPIDDFILFPEDSSAWNPDMSFGDLGEFNFDIADADMNIDFPVDQSFDNSFFQQPFTAGDFNVNPQSSQSYYQHTYSGVQQNFSSAPGLAETYDPMGEPFNIDHFLEPNGPVHSPSQPHPAGDSQGLGQQARSSASHAAPNSLISSTSDWQILESALLSPHPYEGALFCRPASTPTSSESSSSGSQQRVSLGRCLDVVSRTTSVTTSPNDGTHEIIASYDGSAGIQVDPSDIIDVPLLPVLRVSREQNLREASSRVLSSVDSQAYRQESRAPQDSADSWSSSRGLSEDRNRQSDVDRLDSSDLCARAYQATVLEGSSMSVSPSARLETTANDTDTRSTSSRGLDQMMSDRSDIAIQYNRSTQDDVLENSSTSSGCRTNIQDAADHQRRASTVIDNRNNHKDDNDDHNNLKAFSTLTSTLPVLAATVLGSLLLSSKIFGSDIMSILPALAPLLLAFLLFTDRYSTRASPLGFALIVGAALLAAPSVQAFNYLRESANQWVGEDSILSVVKLAFLAVMAAQAPALFYHSNTGCGGNMMLHFLTGAAEIPCPEVRSNCMDDRNIEEQRRPNLSLLAILRDFSPIIPVA